MPPENIVRIFYGYADEDDTALKNKLDRYLLHTNEPNAEFWDCRKIPPGANRAVEINRNLNKSDIILLLISHNFMFSISHDKEIQGITETALTRHHKGDARVISIIFCPVDIEHAPFSMLKVLPEGGKPISLWPDKNRACLNVWNGVKKAIAEIHSRHEAQQKKEKAHENFLYRDYQAALENYDEALFLLKNTAWNKDKIDILRRKATVLRKLSRLEEAFQVYDEAIRIEPDNGLLYQEKGNILLELKHVEKALDAYQHATQKLPDDPLLHKMQGDRLHQGRYWKPAIAAYDKAIGMIAYTHIKDPLTVAQIYTKKGEAHWANGDSGLALSAFDAAIEIHPDDGKLWRNKGAIYFKLGKERFEEAKEAYKEATRLEPSDPYFHKEYGDVLFKLNHLLEALGEYNQAIHFNRDFSLAYRNRSQVFQAIADEKQKEYNRLIKLAKEDDAQFQRLNTQTYE